MSKRVGVPAVNSTGTVATLRNGQGTLFFHEHLEHLYNTLKSFTPIFGPSTLG